MPVTVLAHQFSKDRISIPDDLPTYLVFMNLLRSGLICGHGILPPHLFFFSKIMV